MGCDEYKKHMKGMEYKEDMKMAYAKDDMEKITAKKIVDSAKVDIKKATAYEKDMYGSKA